MKIGPFSFWVISPFAGPLGRGATQIRDVFPKCGGEIDQVILFVEKDLSNMLGDRNFTHRLALAHTFAVIANCLGFVFEIKAQHFLRFVRDPYGFGLHRRHRTKIVDLPRES